MTAIEALRKQIAAVKNEDLRDDLTNAADSVAEEMADLAEANEANESLQSEMTTLLDFISFFENPGSNPPTRFEIRAARRLREETGAV